MWNVIDKSHFLYTWQYSLFEIKWILGNFIEL